MNPPQPATILTVEPGPDQGLTVWLDIAGATSAFTLDFDGAMELLVMAEQILAASVDHLPREGGDGKPVDRWQDDPQAPSE